MSTAKAPAAPSGRICEKTIIGIIIMVIVLILIPIYIIRVILYCYTKVIVEIHITI